MRIIFLNTVSLRAYSFVIWAIKRTPFWLTIRKYSFEKYLYSCLHKFYIIIDSFFFNLGPFQCWNKLFFHKVFQNILNFERMRMIQPYYHQINYQLIKSSATLQKQLNVIEPWLKKWNSEVNSQKSVHVTFTLKKGDSPIHT